MNYLYDSPGFSSALYELSQTKQKIHSDDESRAILKAIFKKCFALMPGLMLGLPSF